ncbi:hypothetical protein NFHSH190041_21300 [Shewanella sp. NFH-SH190041]|nr:hypothetical protein NFHSH190041_21300 [Shewanella sp. NFH-SH190041]
MRFITNPLINHAYLSNSFYQSITCIRPDTDITILITNNIYFIKYDKELITYYKLKSASK